MANFVICEREELEAIADVIRDKIGSSDALSLSDMPTAIAEIGESGGGNEEGSDTITWNGDTTGLYGESMTLVLFHVSDAIPSIVDLEKGYSITLTDGENLEVMDATSASLIEITTGIYGLSSQGILMAAFVATPNEDFEKTGTYLLSSPWSGLYICSLTISGYKGFNGGGGGDNGFFESLMTEAAFISNELTEISTELFRGWQYLKKISLPNVVTTRSAGYICYGCTNLEEVYMPNCTYLGNYAFYNALKLKTINFPKLTEVRQHCFRLCKAATSVNLPVCTALGASAFLQDELIEKMDFPLVASIGATAFKQCSALTTIVLRVNKVCTLANVSAFDSTPIASGTGYIYVPDNLVDSYKADTNWSTYAAQIKPISELEENV